MSQKSFTVKATVPVRVTVDEKKIFCNSSAGYHLYAVDKDGNRRHLETHVGATIRDNTHVLLDGETFFIEAR